MPPAASNLPGVLAAIGPDQFDAALSGSDPGDFERYPDARLRRSILKDMVRFVPELAPLAADSIDGVPPTAGADPVPEVIGFGEPDER